VLLSLQNLESIAHLHGWKISAAPGVLECARRNASANMVWMRPIRLRYQSEMEPIGCACCIDLPAAMNGWVDRLTERLTGEFIILFATHFKILSEAKGSEAEVRLRYRLIRRETERRAEPLSLEVHHLQNLWRLLHSSPEEEVSAVPPLAGRITWSSHAYDPR